MGDHSTAYHSDKIPDPNSRVPKQLPSFAPGNPGKPPGALGGRGKALLTLDRMMGKEKNQERLAEALQDEFDRDPIRFFKTILMPLFPQNIKLDLQQGAQPWGSLEDMIKRRREIDAAKEKAIDVEVVETPNDPGAPP